MQAITHLICYDPYVVTRTSHLAQLCGRRAEKLMDPKNVETLNTILSYWESDFPGLNTVATSAVWADQVQLCPCKIMISWRPPKTDEV
jgi:hypothetical protein